MEGDMMGPALQTYMPVGESDAKAGVSFVVVDVNNVHWLILPAHMGSSDPEPVCTYDFSRWNRQVVIRTSPNTHKAYNLFSADGAPIFNFAGKNGMSDVIAIQLPERLFSPDGDFAGISCLSLGDGPSPSAGPIVVSGFPGQRPDEDYRGPEKATGEILDEYTGTFDRPTADRFGFSGSPVIATDSDDLFGMFIGAAAGRMAVIPAAYIRDVIYGNGPTLPTLNCAAINRQIADRFAEATLYLKNAVIADLTVDHLVNNTVTEPGFAVGVPTGLTTSFGTLCSITRSFTGGKVEIDFSDSITWSGAGPTIYYQVLRDSTLVATGKCGGGTCPDNILMSGHGLDPGATAGSHTYYLQAKYVGSGSSIYANAPLLRINEYKNSK